MEDFAEVRKQREEGIFILKNFFFKKLFDELIILLLIKSWSN